MEIFRIWKVGILGENISKEMARGISATGRRFGWGIFSGGGGGGGVF